MVIRLQWLTRPTQIYNHRINLSVYEGLAANGHYSYWNIRHVMFSLYCSSMVAVLKC